MEQEGIVSPPNGSKPRTVLISTEEYMRRFFGEEDGAEEATE
jgi:DNA segregation ATPase FtsK/SpoIIIE-like protein